MTGPGPILTDAGRQASKAAGRSDLARRAAALALAASVAARAVSAAELGPEVRTILDQLDSPRGIAVALGDQQTRLAVEILRRRRPPKVVQPGNKLAS